MRINGIVRYTKWGTHCVQSKPNGNIVSELYNNATGRLVRRTRSPKGNFITEYFNLKKDESLKPVITEVCEKGENGGFIHRWTNNLMGDVLVFFTAGRYKRPFIRAHSKPFPPMSDEHLQNCLRTVSFNPSDTPVPRAERHAFLRLLNRNYTNEPAMFCPIDRLLSRSSGDYQVGVMTDLFSFIPNIFERAKIHLKK